MNPFHCPLELISMSQLALVGLEKRAGVAARRQPCDCVRETVLIIRCAARGLRRTHHACSRIHTDVDVSRLRFDDGSATGAAKARCGIGRPAFRSSPGPTSRPGVGSLAGELDVEYSNSSG